MAEKRGRRAARAVLATAAALAALAGAAVGAVVARAAGYALDGAPAGPVREAGAGTFGGQAEVGDPAALATNPAGLARLAHAGLVLAPAVLVARTEFAGVAPSPGYGVLEQTQRRTYPPWSAFAAERVSDRIVLAAGVDQDFGAKADWSDSPGGTTATLSRDFELHAVNFVGGAAATLGPRWAVGAAVRVIASNVDFLQSIAPYDPNRGSAWVEDGPVVHSPNATSVGGALGVSYAPDARATIGASFRTAVRAEHSPGESAGVVPVAGGGGPPDSTSAVAPISPGGRFVVELPARVGLAAAWRASPAWRLAAGVAWTHWSGARASGLYADAGPTLDVALAPRWNDVVSADAEARFRPHGTSPWRASLAYAFDPSPVPVESLGPLLPDATRHVIAPGVGWSGGRVSLDAEARFALAPDRSTEGANQGGYQGTYSPRLFTARLTAGFCLEGPR